MKATGIVRRIDDLGRVVIPKEIRRTMRIRESDPLEIFVGPEGEIILKKYSPIGELGQFAKECAESVCESTGKIVLITDRDEVIAVSGAAKKNYLGRPIGPMVEKAMESRRVLSTNYNDLGGVGSYGAIIADESGESSCRFTGEVIAPIVSQGDPIGSIIICSQEAGVGDAENKIAETLAKFIAKQMVH